MKIYLAGKFTQPDWRRQIVSGDWPIPAEEFPQVESWPVMPSAIFGEHDYVGPYFIPGHGELLRERFENAEQGHRLDSSDPSSLHNPDWNVPRLCRKAMSEADLMFFWIDRLDSFATLLEVGYALGRQADFYEEPYTPQEIVIASPTGAFNRRHPDGCLCMSGHCCSSPHDGTLSQLWFLPGFAYDVRNEHNHITLIDADTPATALRRALHLPPETEIGLNANSIWDRICNPSV